MRTGMEQREPRGENCSRNYRVCLILDWHWPGLLNTFPPVPELIPPSMMMPQRRFTTLIEQAFTHQRTHCLYHNAPYTPETFSLYTDHHCSREAFPYLTTNILSEHIDEVWNIKWSHDGNYLASASKDTSAAIWHIGVRQLLNRNAARVVN